MLALFGILLFALMGVSALALDMGVAGLAQARLEVAAEYVALQRARGVPESVLRTQAEALLVEGTGRSSRIAMGPIGPLEGGDPGCAGGFPTASEGTAILARRVPLLFGQGTLLQFATPTTYGDILDARNDPANPDPTPVLPDASIPPGTLALREQGLCVEGRGQVRLEPALAIVGNEQRRLPGVDSGLLLQNPNLLWQTRASSRETTCLDTPQDGPWFEVTTDSVPCEATDTTCAVNVPVGGFEVVGIGEDLVAERRPGEELPERATLTPVPEPLDVDEHRTVVAPLRGGDGRIVGFVSLCARRVGPAVFVSWRWNDEATPLSVFTAELHQSDARVAWEEGFLKTSDPTCDHPDDERLKCWSQAAVLAMPGAGT